MVKRADAGLSLASLRVHLAAIQAAHRLAGLALDLKDPRLAMVLEGVARTNGTRPGKRAAAAAPDALRRMLAARPGADTTLGARDRAMLLVGFGPALRGAELAALCLGDISFKQGSGLTVLVRRSKTDPRAAGQEVAVWANPVEPDFCVQTALEAWLGFRRRAGLTTAAGEAGAGLADLMRQTRHRSTDVALGCLRPTDLWRNNVTERVFRAARKDSD
ncbi:hypothetical protein [Siccirubricoccus sp. G192]|uniref:hypothetical protein n=1 Tax=Siccirubricoccus sp. G192 TaxID=2849651 RepID=UPI001C2BFDC6|nr:hypothetical protein [Siccirubricoccus sp. G192]MBV1800507.1 hypothetical protein [Siccirubricoccus sp. G192]